jgi:hypothetical protein
LKCNGHGLAVSRVKWRSMNGENQPLLRE